MGRGQLILLGSVLRPGLIKGGPGLILPTANSFPRDLRVELKGEGGLAIAHGLVREALAVSEMLGPTRQLELVEMRLGDMELLGEIGRPGLGPVDRIIAELMGLAGLGADSCAEYKGDRLRALADPDFRCWLLAEQQVRPLARVSAGTIRQI